MMIGTWCPPWCREIPQQRTIANLCPWKDFRSVYCQYRCDACRPESMLVPTPLYAKGSSMSIETTYPHIEKFGSEPARLERLPRIRVAQIAADYLAYGWSADEMCRQHSYLTHAEAHAAMAYGCNPVVRR